MLMDDESHADDQTYSFFSRQLWMLISWIWNRNKKQGNGGGDDYLQAGGTLN